MSLSEDIRHMVDEYVHNHIPIYLLHLPDMKLVHRDTMKQYLWQWITEMTRSYMGVQKVDIEKIWEGIKDRLAYAILSHRWLGTGEASFEDVQNGQIFRLRGSGGFMKLQRFCEEAFNGFGCEWAWADTCCIDKRSSADLEESIRSMFSWYRNARACIVYLADVVDSRAWHQSVWFSRGWTLQELLAPKRMKFFMKNWTPLTPDVNDKDNDSILQTIRHITGIPVNDLRSFEPRADRIREKMTWASKRTTTRVEDKAYCLIGILDVSLTISYGEGERAFFRLQVEIIRNSLDWGLLLWNGQPSKYNSALAAGPECFTSVDISSISDILMSIATDIAMDIIFSHHQIPRVFSYVAGNSWTKLEYKGRSSIISHRDHEVNAHYLSKDQFLKKIFLTPGFIWTEIHGNQNFIIHHKQDTSKSSSRTEFKGFLSVRPGLSRPPWPLNFEEIAEEDIQNQDSNNTYNEITGSQTNIISVASENLFVSEDPGKEFYVVKGDQTATFVLSDCQSNGYLIALACKDLAIQLAGVLGLGLALFSDLRAGFDADCDEHMFEHVLFHIKTAFDPAIDEATRRLNTALEELDPNLERCTVDIQSRVRQALNAHYDSIYVPASMLRALRDRKLTSLSSRTSFELTQRGLRLEMPLLDVRGLELLEMNDDVHIYKLDVPGLQDIFVETTETLRVLSPMTLKLAILDFREYAGFNILNELGPKQDNHHQALVLRLLRADMAQYRRVATEGIVHVRSDWGNNFETSIQTVYVR